MKTRPGLILIASEGFRRDPAGPFLPLVRDYSDQLRSFRLHSTKGTVITMLSTGEFTSNDPTLPNYEPQNPDIITYRFGREGGVVEIAALVPNRGCEAVMFFIDPNDSYSEFPENRALQRVCKELGVRLISTIEMARQWLEFEAERVPDLGISPPGRKEWEEGNSNVDEHSGVFRPLTWEEQTLALIAHDRRKEDLVLFVNQHGDFLQRFHRILTTGTTGFALKLLFGTPDQVKSVTNTAPANLGPRRFQQLIDGTARLLLEYSTDLDAAEAEVCSWTNDDRLQDDLKDWITKGKPRTGETPRPMLLEIDEIRDLIGKRGLIRPQQQLIDRIRPVRSGPQGGDILLANEVLAHKCHAAVFFQDPQSAHAHDPDIRLFERTCHFWSAREPKNRVYIACISDSRSAHKWAVAVRSVPAGEETRSSIAEALRRRGWQLRDVVLIDRFLHGNRPEDLGKALVEVGARYFLRELRFRLEGSGRVTIGVGHGETLQRVVSKLKELRAQVPFRVERRVPQELVCVPLVGNVSQYDIQRQATAIARELAELLGGGREVFEAPGVIPARDFDQLSEKDLKLIDVLSNADLILVAGGTYGDCERESHPVQEAANGLSPAGIISSIVLDGEGRPMEEFMRTVGIGFDGLKRAAGRGRVLFLCAGEARRPLLLAAMRAGLVSVLVTDMTTANWLADQPPVKSPLSASEQFRNT